MKVITDPRCSEYGGKGHPERPQRILKSVEKLRNQTDLPIEWLEPLPVNDAVILLAHSEAHLENVKHPSHDFDGDTPAYLDIEAHARRSVGGALQALNCAKRKEVAFSLLRPPGHHATQEQAMGFCYFNSIAISVLEALRTGARKVAVFDFDVHHGNGAEAILRGKKEAAFFSVHQYPAYPGTGAESFENCWNFPVAPGASRATYRAALEQAFEALSKFKPQLIAVSAGFDAFRGDPLSSAALEEEDFHWLGRTFRETSIPTFHLLEGGYSHELPNLIFAYLKGLEGV